MSMRSVLCTLFVLFLAAPVWAEQPDAGQACRDQLGLVTALASEYDTTRDTAVREKVVYKRAFENERAHRLALEKQVAEIKAKLEPKPDEKSKE